MAKSSTQHESLADRIGLGVEESGIHDIDLVWLCMYILVNYEVKKCKTHFRIDLTWWLFCPDQFIAHMMGFQFQECETGAKKKKPPMVKNPQELPLQYQKSEREEVKKESLEEIYINQSKLRKTKDEARQFCIKCQLLLFVFVYTCIYDRNHFPH